MNKIDDEMLKLLLKIDIKQYWLEFDDRNNWELYYSTDFGVTKENIIMSSKNKTFKDLKKWVKKHEEKHLNLEITKYIFISDLLAFTMLVIAFKLNNYNLKGISEGVIYSCLGMKLYIKHIQKHNNDVLKLKLKESRKKM